MRRFFLSLLSGLFRLAAPTLAPNSLLQHISADSGTGVGLEQDNFLSAVDNDKIEIVRVGPRQNF